MWNMYFQHDDALASFIKKSYKFFKCSISKKDESDVVGHKIDKIAGIDTAGFFFGDI